jgi:hypothetical protein
MQRGNHTMKRSANIDVAGLENEREHHGKRVDLIVSHHSLGSKRERTPRQIGRPGTQRFGE